MKKFLPYAALLVAHLIWGANFVVAKVTLQEIPAMSLAFSRFAFALILILPFVLTMAKRPKIKLADLPKLVLVGLLLTTVNIALFFIGIEKTTATSASVLTLIIPGLSVLLGWIYFKEKVFTINIVGIAMGLIGALVIIGLPLILLGLNNSEQTLGNLLIILASITWVIGLLISKELLEKYGSLMITTFSFGVGAITFLIPAIREYVQNPAWISQVSALGYLGLTYITLLSSITAFFLLEWGISKMSVSRANIFQYLEPLIATTLGVAVLGERISYSFIVGAIMIGLGVYWGTLGKEHHHRAHKMHRT